MVMRQEEFTAGMTDDQHELEAYNDTTELDNGTLFDDNSLILLKQANKYAVQGRIKSVALFDWDTLFLNYFENISYEDGYVGQSSCGTYITWSNEMRRALLGFLEAAQGDSIGTNGIDGGGGGKSSGGKSRYSGKSSGWDLVVATERIKFDDGLLVEGRGRCV